MFPALAQPSGDLGDIEVPDESPHPGVMMPTRRQTRDQDRRDRITKERREREQLNAVERRENASTSARPRGQDMPIAACASGSRKSKVTTGPGNGYFAPKTRSCRAVSAMLRALTSLPLR